MELVIFAILGACVGSFLNVVIYRVPENLSVVSPRSFCRTCEKTIAWYHNIPILSWMFLGGKSACCKEKISIQYPLIEVLCMVLFILIWYKNDYSYQSILIASIFSIYLALSAIDYYYHAIPDSVSLTLLFVSIFPYDILQSIEAAFILVGFMTILRWYVSYFLKKEALGEGDVIIAGAMGALLGIKFALIAVFLAALLALPFSIIAKKKEIVIPFVPFLSLGVLLVFLFDDYVNIYLKTIGY